MRIRRCSRSGCSNSAVATLTYVYADSTAVLGPLATQAEPHCYDLCIAHAQTLSVPRGWEVIRLQVEEEPKPSTDDLEALANAVREVGLSYDPAPTAESLPRPPGIVELGRRGHLTVLADPATTAVLDSIPAMIRRGIFKANDIRGVTEGSAPEWDEAGAYAIGAALVDVLDLTAAEGSLVLGRDMRLSSPRMSAAFADGVASRGVNVIDIGLASTDELWFASGDLDLPGAMFTASHNPGEYNGIKFCLAGAKPIAPEQLTAIADRAIDPAPAPARTPGKRTEQDLLPAYAEHLHSLVDLSGIRRLVVVADAGNGMAGHTLPAVLGSSNLEIIGLYTDPDGTFPNHAPNPLESENLVDAAEVVRERGADLALVFDGDADRCFVLDERGDVVSPSAITAMIASAELQRIPGATIVCNKITSWVVREIVMEAGGRIVITRVGHTFVKAAMAEHDAVFGGEHSAHYYFRDFWGADTGMLAAMHVLAMAGRSEQPLSELAAGFNRYAASGEINSRVDDQQVAMERVAQAFAGRGEQDRLDGLTVAGSDWWVNVRPSNTEPLLRLNVEAASAEVMAALRDETLDLIRA